MSAEKLEQEIKELSAKVDQILKLLQKRDNGGDAPAGGTAGRPPSGGGQFGGTPTSRR